MGENSTMQIGIDQKRSVLESVYRIYDAWSDTIDHACRRGCAACCTQNMTLTTLEGYGIIQFLARNRRLSLLGILSGATGSKKFQPRLTINEIAQICRSDGDVPEEDIPRNPSPCFLLRDEECPIYPVRPFGCRCMVSRRLCKTGGTAEMSDWVLTVNRVFQQTIEHLDVPGGTGNLADVLDSLMHDSFLASYRNGTANCRSWKMAPNRHAPVLMVPPEFRKRIQPILQSLSELEPA
jgi:hypothetical protein